jgi:outer membrane lipoprotein-sorting protein
MRCLLVGLVVLVQGSLAGVAAAADLTADEILVKVDAAGSGIKDEQALMEMVVQDPGHEPRHMMMQLYARGPQRRITFLSPGDVKGFRLLTLNREQTYVYLPAFRKVRRIASHVREQSSFGSDYNYEDASMTSFHEFWSPQLVSQDAAKWVLKITPKPGTESSYGAIELDVQKDTFQVHELRFFSPSGAKQRTETRDDYECKDGNCISKHTKMVNHAHDNHWTEVFIKELQLNSNFPETVFSLRDFQRTE